MALLAAPLWLGERVQAAPATESVVLCVGDFPPYNSPGLPHMGPVIELTEEALRRGGYATRFEFMPWARILKEGENAACGILGIWRNRQREASFDFSLPILQQELGFFVQSAAIPDLGRPEQRSAKLSSLLIGVERGSYLSPPLNDPNLHLDAGSGIHANLKKLAHQRVQLVFGAKDPGLYVIEHEAGLKGVVQWLPPALERKEIFLAFAKRHPQGQQLLAAFDKGLLSMRTDGSYQKLLKAAGLSGSMP